MVAVLLGMLCSPCGLEAQALGEQAARARSDSNDAQLNYQVALGFWQQKNWDEAEHYLRQAIAVAPQYAEALLAMGQLPAMRGEGYWKRYEAEKGRAATDSTLDRYAEYRRRAFMVNPMVDLAILGDVEVSEYLTFGTYDFRNVTFRVWWIKPWRRAATLLHQGNAAAAHAALDTLVHDRQFGGTLAQVPNVVLWYHGMAAARVNDWDTAIEAFAILTGRGVQREKDIAAQAALAPNPFRPPLERYPTNDYRYGLGTMLYLAGRYHQAAPVFRRVLEIDLSVFPAHVQLARMFEAQGDWAGAVAEREAAVATFPEDATLQMELAVTLVRAGRLEDGIRVMNDAMLVNPRDYRVPLLLGEMLMTAGRQQEARAPYERFLAIAPLRLSDQIAAVRQTLAQIQ